ncbi:ATPase [Micromonospora sp. WMMA1923]|uniref:ATPase n=1 Tax=Micromonospora sp. WMMA1923 TaxID=3404125 RepID=UPI003B92937E
MRFSVVANGYDQGQVDSCLTELSVGLTRLAARAEGVVPGRDADQIRQEAVRLRTLVDRRVAAAGRPGREPADLERRAAEVFAQARIELDAAREEARQLRERAYAEAVRARREFEAALQARRRRADQVDELLSDVTVEAVPVDQPTAAAGGVPATRAAAGAVEPPPGPQDARVR